TATALPGVTIGVLDAQSLRILTSALTTRLQAIDATTVAAIPGIAQRAQGLPPVQQLAEIRALVGLTEGQAASVARYRQGLIEAGHTPAQIQRLVTQRASVLRQQRAERIARTETVAAAALGQQALWEQQVREGVLPVGVRRQWVTSEDEKVCPTICAPIP